MWKSAWYFLSHKRINAKKQIRNLSFKNLYFGPLKKRVFGFLRKRKKYLYFFMFRLWFSFKNNRCSNVLLVGIFENALKKAISPQKRHVGCFRQLVTFFIAFLKIVTKTTLVCLLFLKLKQKKKISKKIRWPPKKRVYEFWNKNR